MTKDTVGGAAGSNPNWVKDIQLGYLREFQTIMLIYLWDNCVEQKFAIFPTYSVTFKSNFLVSFHWIVNWDFIVYRLTVIRQIFTLLLSLYFLILNWIVEDIWNFGCVNSKNNISAKFYSVGTGLLTPNYWTVYSRNITLRWKKTNNVFLSQNPKDLPW